MRTLLLILTCFIALSSIISGLMMISNPAGDLYNLPLSLLDGTPFTDYLVPGILLTLIVGIVNLHAVFYIVEQHPYRYNWAMAGGFIIIAWIIVQIILISMLQWLHFIYFFVGVLIILIAYQLKGKWAV
ncbi:MAG TPA: hypothetical protein VLR49_06910 [Ferruginibacter sp.]|nr:hypothetical protein [Ferruginibacter sp.]